VYGFNEWVLLESFQGRKMDLMGPVLEKNESK
jgi:hypothetical protein